MSYQRRSTYSNIPIKSESVRLRKTRSVMSEKKAFLSVCFLICAVAFLTLPFSFSAKRYYAEKPIFSENGSVSVFTGKGAEQGTVEDEMKNYDDYMDSADIEAAARKYAEEHTPRYVFPLDGYITSAFANRIDPITLNEEEYHLGIDISAQKDTEISAYSDGVVKKTVISDDGYGIHLIIEHDGFETLYAHCSKLLVPVGELVKAGDVIAIAGSTGRSTGIHLHFEVRIDGVQVDPILHMENNGVKRYA